VWTVLVAFLEFLSVFAEGFFALFAGESLGLLGGVEKRRDLVEGQNTISDF
jgi:hypothetical protein